MGHEVGGDGGTRSGLTERSGHGEAIGKVIAQAQDALVGHPAGVAAHGRRIGEEEERTGDERHIEDVHTGAAKNLLGKDHSKGAGHGDDPQRTVYRHDKGHYDTRNEVTLVNLLVLVLCHDELYAESDDVGHDNLGQHGQETIAKELPEGALHTGGGVVLVAHVIHAKEQCGQQGDDHKRHDSLAVDGVVHVHTTLGGCVGHKQECLEAIEDRPEGVQLATLLE